MVDYVHCMKMILMISDSPTGVDDGRASTVLSSCVWLGKHKGLAKPRAYVFKCIIPFLTSLYHTGGVIDASGKGM